MTRAATDPIPEFCRAETLVLGCGNVLFGDDGFGPAVVDHLHENFTLPPGMCALNAGLSVRQILFTLVLSETRPRRIIIVDAVAAGREPGAVFDLEIAALPPTKIDDFSMHQLPTSNLLRELKELCGVEVRIVSAQVAAIPDSVRPGLSRAVRAAVPVACRRIMEQGTG